MSGSATDNWGRTVTCDGAGNYTVTNPAAQGGAVAYTGVSHTGLAGALAAADGLAPPWWTPPVMDGPPVVAP